MNLDLYLAGDLIARTAPRSRGRKFVIEYTDAVRSVSEPGSPLLSCSLPTPGPSGPAASWAFLEGLLPEGAALSAMAATVRSVRLQGDSTAEPTDALNLLAVYGRDCAGAVTVVPEGGPPAGAGRYEPIDSADIARALVDLPRRPLGADPAAEIRMLLAGNQPKLLLARRDGRWWEPVDGAPSTHILKPTGAWPLSADNECVVMTIARSVGLTHTPVRVDTFGGTRVLVVERWDRRAGPDGGVMRLHQEDMGQALGIRPRDKYDIGRPSRRMAALLRQVPIDDTRAAVRELLRQVAFRAIVGDEDGHGKNFGLLLEGSTVRLAPLYDSLCTQLYPDLGGTLATPIGVQQNLAEVDLAALMEEGIACGIDAASSRMLVLDLADQISAAIGTLAADGLDERAVSAVTATLRGRIERLRREEPMGVPSYSALLSPRGTISGGTLDRITGERLSPG